MPEVLSISDLSFKYDSNYQVKLPELKLNSGQIKSLTGVSGSGKSTILECIGLLRSGFAAKKFMINGQDVTKYYGKKLEKFRALNIGYMPQVTTLLPFLSVEQNFELQIDVANSFRKQPNTDDVKHNYVMEICEILNISNLMKHYPSNLSVGQKQRVSFVKAVAHRPQLLLIDEPTSALDPQNAKIIFSEIVKITKHFEIASLVVTHDIDLLKQFSINGYSYHDGDSKTENNCAIFKEFQFDN